MKEINVMVAIIAILVCLGVVAVEINYFRHRDEPVNQDVEFYNNKVQELIEERDSLILVNQHLQIEILILKHDKPEDHEKL